MKKQIHPNIKAQLLRGAFFLLLLLAVCAFALGQQLTGAPSPNENPTGFVCFGCPFPGGWQLGPDMPSTGVRMVGVVTNTSTAPVIFINEKETHSCARKSGL